MYGVRALELRDEMTPLSIVPVRSAARAFVTMVLALGVAPVKVEIEADFVSTVDGDDSAFLVSSAVGNATAG